MSDTPASVGLWHSLLLGIVEGLTEFLPVSSTGHLIVVNRLLGQDDPAFEVAIQIGAISAVLFLYRVRLWRELLALLGRGRTGRVNLFWLLLAAAMPAALLGLVLDDWLETMFATRTVAWTTLIGGVLLLWLERWLQQRERAGRARDLAIPQMTLRDALGIGLCQCLALIPGTSRSGATIAGALLLGYSRPAAAEFSFLVGLPILYGACLLKLGKHGHEFTGERGIDLVTAMGAAFVTAALVVKPFVAFLQRHTFVPFAIYRILAGAALLALLAAGVV